MQQNLTIILTIFIGFLSYHSASLAGNPSSTTSFQAGSMAQGAPPELMHWGKLVGQWSTTEESLKADGSGWQASGAADWDLFWAFDGWGIQDNYISPPKSVALKDETKRQRGTNLRIYNPQEKKWILTWLTTTSSKAESYTAVSSDETIVMLSEQANAKGNFSRITFFGMTDTKFEWKLEWSKDKQNWAEVYRIHGVKKND